MKTEKARSVPLLERADASPTMKDKAQGLERCAAAAAAGLVLSACASVPARPPERDCSDQAIKAMKKLHVTLGEEFDLVLDVNRPGGASDVSTFRDGPVVSVLQEGYGSMPSGTLVYGQLWVSGKRILGHWDSAKLPSGEIIPVCFAIGGPIERKPGLPKLWGSKEPGTVEMAREVGVWVVERFEYE